VNLDKSSTGTACASLAIGMILAMTTMAAQEIESGEADSKADDSAAASEVAPAETVDEITVYGEKTVPAIKAQIMRADHKMYGIWNEMNTEREFDVHCRLEGVYASRRKERICLPAFEHGVLEESWDDLSTWTGAGRPEAEIREKREILRKKMIEFAAQNPDLRAAIIERANLQRDLAEAEARDDDGDEE